MTPQEQQMIDGLIGRIRSTPAQNKDTDAEQHIQSSLASYPDALYVLVQTVLVQQYGLQQAQSQIGELKQQVQTLQANAEKTTESKPSGGGSFLSHLFGGSSNESSSTSSQQTSTSGHTEQGYQPVHNPSYGGSSFPQQQGYPGQSYPTQGNYAGQSYPTQTYPAQGGYPPPPPYAPQGGYGPSGGGYAPVGGGMFGGGGGGFMQGALQTAAGVAAGEMMFRGMEDLFSGFGGHERGFTSGMGGGETIVNNNYYDEDRKEGRGFSDESRDDGNFYNPEHDASRSEFSSSDSSDIGRDDDQRGFADAGGNDFNNTGDDLSDATSDDSGFTDSGDTDSGDTDSGGFDDSGSDDFRSDNS